MCAQTSSVRSEADLADEEEQAFHDYGPMFGCPPPLFRAKQRKGKAVYAALISLLDHVEAKGEHAKEVRAILASCLAGTDHAVTLSTALFGMPAKLLRAVIRVFEWVSLTRGLSLDDFDDGGARFLRLVLRKRPKAIAALTGGATP